MPSPSDPQAEQRDHILGLTYAARSGVWPHSRQGTVKSRAV